MAKSTVGIDLDQIDDNDMIAHLENKGYIIDDNEMPAFGLLSSVTITFYSLEERNTLKAMLDELSRNGSFQIDWN